MSDLDGVLTFSLPNPPDRLSQKDDYFGFFNKAYEGAFQLTARAGDRITGYALSGQFGGETMVPAVPSGRSGTSGVATTRASLSIGSGAAQGTMRSRSGSGCGAPTTNL